MPLYNWKCLLCGAARTVFAKIDDRDNPVACERQCEGLTMQRQIAAPRIVTDYEGYQSPVTGQWVEGRKAHREDLARTGCRVYEPGETEAFKRRKAQDEERFLDGIAETAAAEVSKWSSEKQAKLGEALAGGEISYNRI